MVFLKALGNGCSQSCRGRPRSRPRVRAECRNLGSECLEYWGRLEFAGGLPTFLFLLFLNLKSENNGKYRKISCPGPNPVVFRAQNLLVSLHFVNICAWRCSRSTTPGGASLAVMDDSDDDLSSTAALLAAACLQTRAHKKRTLAVMLAMHQEKRERDSVHARIPRTPMQWVERLNGLSERAFVRR